MNMKRKLLLLAAVGGFFCVTMSSYTAGVGSIFPGGGNRTGVPNATGNKDNCSRPSGCHSPNTGGPAIITLWDLTTNSAVTNPLHYYTTHSYQLRLAFKAGSAVTTTTSRRFGFQLSSFDRVPGVYLSNVVSNPNNDFIDPSSGTVVSNLGASLLNAYNANGNSMVENGGGKLISLYNTDAQFTDSMRINWYPPGNPLDVTPGDSTVDSVSFYAVYLMTDTTNYNANTGDPGVNPGVDICGYGNTLTFYRHKNVDVAKVFANANIVAYPNPTTSDLRIAMSGAETGFYIVNVYDLSGKKVSNQTVNVNSSVYTIDLNSGNWPKGMYQVQLIKDDVSHTMAVIKQ